MPKKAVILHNPVAPDAPKDDLDTIIEVEAVERALVDLGLQPQRVEFSLDLKTTMSQLKEAKPDFVFNLVESIEGQDRYVYLAPAMLDYMRLPYTGACTESLFISSNKILAKEVFSNSGIRTPDWVTLGDMSRADALIGKRCIVKSVWDHASQGLSDDSVFTPASHGDLEAAMLKKRLNNDSTWFVERYIPGREFNMTIIGSKQRAQVMPPAEIVFRDFPAGKPHIVSYAAKWFEDSFEYQNTIRTFEFPEVDDSMLSEVVELVERCWSSFRLNGYARVDLRVDEDNRPWVLEINCNPCISPDSGLVAAVERAGMAFNEFIQTTCRTLVVQDREVHPRRNEIEREYASRL